MAAGYNPGLIWNAWRIRAEGYVVSTIFDDAQTLMLFLGQDVAEDATLFGLEIVASGAELVEDAARHESGCGELGSRVVEFRSGPHAVILENADVLKSAVTLQILNPQRDQAQELLNFAIARVPEMAVMTGIFEQNLVCAHRSHAVVEAVAAASRLPLDVIERMRMDYGARRPCAALHAREVGDDLGRLGPPPPQPAPLQPCIPL